MYCRQSQHCLHVPLATSFAFSRILLSICTHKMLFDITHAQIATRKQPSRFWPNQYHHLDKYGETSTRDERPKYSNGRQQQRYFPAPQEYIYPHTSDKNYRYHVSKTRLCTIDKPHQFAFATTCFSRLLKTTCVPHLRPFPSRPQQPIIVYDSTQQDN